MALIAIVTNAGRAALVNASNTGTAPVTISQVGLTATAVVPGVGITALPGEYKRVATISGDVVADDTIHLIVRDESADVFTVRSFALYLPDGTLFAVYGQAGVILEKSAQAMMLLAIDIQFADVDANLLTFGDANFLNPPATTSVQGVVELSTEEEATTGVDAVRAVTPKGMKTAVTSWINSRFGDGAPSDFVKGLLTAASAVAMRLALGLKSAALKDEGAGNGLDADLLDGQHGAYYSNIPARLGYVPWGPANDGSGSGLDADLLDGQDGSYYANITARLGYTPANKAGDVFFGSVTVVPGASVGVNASAVAGGVILAPGDATHTGLLSLYQPNGTRLGYMGFATNGGRMNYVSENGTGHSFLGGWAYRDGNVIWDGGNDGSGSGLDADLLDGQDGNYYANIIARLGYTPANKAGDTFTGAVSATGPVYSVSASPAFIWRPSGAVDRATAYYDQAASALTIALSDASGVGVRSLSMFQTGAIFWGGNTIWHAGNDGSGSGLDADLLDGQDGGYYSNIIARLGYTPANRAGDMFLGSVTVVPGASMGVNASAVAGGVILAPGDATHTGLLSLYQPNGARLGYIGYASNGARMNYVSENGAGHSFINGWIYRDGNVAWDAGNDGSGSGLDADLLDGYQATDFNRITSSSLAPNGRRVHSDGYIEHWGVDNSRRTGENSFYFPFPTPFPNECFGVSFTTINTSVSNSGASFLQEVSLTKDGVTVYLQSDTSGQNDFYGFRWIARGR